MAKGKGNSAKKGKQDKKDKKVIVEEEEVKEEVVEEEEEVEEVEEEVKNPSPAVNQQQSRKTKKQLELEEEQRKLERKKIGDEKFDHILKDFTETIKVDEYLFSIGNSSNFFVAGASVAVLPAYVFITPFFNLPLIQYSPFLALIVIAGGYFLMKAHLGVAVKAERDILKSRNIRSKKPASGEAEPSKNSAAASAGSEAINWALFINNTVFLIISLLLALFVVPSLVGFALEGETTDENGVVTTTTIEDAVSESTLEKIWVVGCGISVIAPAFLLSRGITIV